MNKTLLFEIVAFLVALSLLLVFASRSAAQPKMKKPTVFQETVLDFKRYFPEVKFPTRKNFVTFTENMDQKVMDPITKKSRLAHAVCEMDWKNRNGGPKITINKQWWDSEKISWYKKKVLMHEFGHCILNLRHPENRAANTIMSSTLTTVKKDGSNWGYLMRELRTRWLKTQ